MSGNVEAIPSAYQTVRAAAIIPEPRSSTTCAVAIEGLEGLGIAMLQKHWQQMFERRPPPRLGAELLRRAIGYRLQELAQGGLSRPARLYLKNKSQAPRTPQQGLEPLRIIKPGTRFVREWRGEIHEVRALDTGKLEYRGANYASLSVIARRITGTPYSGPRFFGLKDSVSRPENGVPAHG